MAWDWCFGGSATCQRHVPTLTTLDSVDAKNRVPTAGGGEESRPYSGWRRRIASLQRGEARGRASSQSARGLFEGGAEGAGDGVEEEAAVGEVLDHGVGSVASVVGAEGYALRKQTYG